MIRDLLSTDHVIISSWHHTSMVLALDVRSRTVGSSNIPSCLPAWHGKLTTWTLADSQSFPPTWASPFSHIHKYLSPHVCTRQSRTAVILYRSSQVLVLLYIPVEYNFCFNLSSEAGMQGFWLQTSILKKNKIILVPFSENKIISVSFLENRTMLVLWS